MDFKFIVVYFYLIACTFVLLLWIPNENENDLLQQLQSGNEDAIKAIFDTFYEKLCLYAESIIRDHQAAEEIVEDLFVYLWLHADTLMITTSLKSYLFKSTFNNCLKYIRRVKAERKLVDKPDYRLEDDEILYPPSHLHPLSDLFSGELIDKARQVLESLPDQCRLIYSLNRHEDLNYPEIAKKLNISVGTVKTQMSRAFNKFRSGLKEFLP
jgi:RNA polymerase sigma-70 factor, ECF subfamily